MITPQDVYGVTITGTRQTAGIDKRKLAILFRATTFAFDSPDTTWYVGGAAGIDTLFLEWLNEYLTGYIHVVVPKRLGDQPKVAQDAIARAAKKWTNKHDFQLTELNSQAGSPECYFARNRWMVDRSQALIGFPHESKPSNGTMYTISYAASLGMPHTIWPIK